MDEQPDRVSRIRPRISRRPLFHDSGSESYVYDDAVLFRFEIPEMGRGGGSTRVLIDGFRYVEFEWVVIKRGEGKGGREKRKGKKMCAFLAKFPSSK